jgi:hypothetical protein
MSGGRWDYSNSAFIGISILRGENKLEESAKKSKQIGKRLEQNGPGRDWSEQMSASPGEISLLSLPGLFCWREAGEMPAMDSGFKYTLAKQASGATSGHAAPYRNYCR